MYKDNEKTLLMNLDKLHTTTLGEERMKRNLDLHVDDVIAWCKEMISKNNHQIIRNGKNWYVTTSKCIITVNVYSYTVITAHKIK